MTKEEVMLCGELYEKVVYDCEPDREYYVRAVSVVYANGEELARHIPRKSDIVTLIDSKSGERKKAGPAQLTPANPGMLALKLQAQAMQKEK